MRRISGYINDEVLTVELLLKSLEIFPWKLSWCPAGSCINEDFLAICNQQPGELLLHCAESIESKYYSRCNAVIVCDGSIICWADNEERREEVSAEVRQPASQSWEGRNHL